MLSLGPLLFRMLVLIEDLFGVLLFTDTVTKNKVIHTLITLDFIQRSLTKLVNSQVAHIMGTAILNMIFW